MKIEDGGQGCRKCGGLFRPTPSQIAKSDYECPACKRSRQNALNAADPNFKEKKRSHNNKPHVKAYHSKYRIERMKSDPMFRIVRAARRKVATEVEAGRLIRKPCELCGVIKTEAHHEDYHKPLQVRWLCRRHHMEVEHASAS